MTAFLFAIDPLTEREVYVRSGPRAELDAQAQAECKDGRIYFVMPKPLPDNEVDAAFEGWLDQPDPKFPHLSRRTCMHSDCVHHAKAGWHAALRWAL